ncbi:MAG TPA: tRNA (adenosine(37)-N6)-threonylcarbamoyltransferase complex dimerization subunit type 1 TsaB [Methyloceanibacter sp.]|nr:tRNA (adenosine(37)-N6)-threonylcarbamoyltransferase complex dimerization subunit type 1 TsaB [Methyloceanibacter sp.]
MNILALDTSMGSCSAAVLRDDGAGHALYVRDAEMARGHAEALMPMVAEAIAEAKLRFDELDLIAATQGPGSFTGVRIAIAAALGLALVTRAKLYGTDSLTVMARTALATGMNPKGPFAVAVDARRSMLYFGLYDEMGQRLDGPLLVAPDEAVDLLPNALSVTVGSGAALLADAVARRGRFLDAKLPGLQPSAAALAEIARSSDESFPTLRPLYLRPPDAKPQTPLMATKR